VVVAIISSARGARAAIDVERCGVEVSALGIVATLDATDLVSSKGNLMERRELAFEPVLISFSEA
jgi:hypothetical protein